MDTRRWLRANGYGDIADMIDEIMNEWKAAGKKTRRNWWDVLAGHKNGNPSVREGRTFPVLRAARLRKGWSETENAICRNSNEEIPPILPSNRWPKDA